MIYAYKGKGEIYQTQGDYTAAASFFTKAWEMDVEYHGKEVAERYRYEIGAVLFLQGKYDEALPHLKAGTLARKEYEREFAPKYLLRLSECYQRLGRYKEALDYRIQGFELQEKINQDKIANLESEALIKYETGKKDQQLAEQAQLIQQKTKIQWLSIGIAVSLALLLSALFYFFKRNQKTTAALAVKNSENELLLKEIHHRVKNNLEMVSSLLKLQSVKTKDQEAKEVMRASQNRVQSMGILHQKLYQGENLGSIEMLDYFQNLSENIVDAFGANDKVEVQYDMDRVELDVDTAVPIGLIVNELLTNSLKYAFPEDRKGKIELSLKEMDEKQLQLVVADNGVGQTAGASPKGTGFGSQLVQLLTSQLQGSMQADYSRGTRLVFQLEKAHWA
ncbi:MAG: tetratricopeptide repeat protein [Saprospiraceae bacterium]|nr:tetratricopeptide repeat protein [Saprospiraceae bacterium]